MHFKIASEASLGLVFNGWVVALDAQKMWLGGGRGAWLWLMKVVTDEKQMHGWVV